MEEVLLKILLENSKEFVIVIVVIFFIYFNLQINKKRIRNLEENHLTTLENKINKFQDDLIELREKMDYEILSIKERLSRLEIKIFKK